LAVTVKVATVADAAAGLKSTMRMQLELAANTGEQVLVCA